MMPGELVPLELLARGFFRAATDIFTPKPIQFSKSDGIEEERFHPLLLDTSMCYDGRNRVMTAEADPFWRSCYRKPTARLGSPEGGFPSRRSLM